MDVWNKECENATNNGSASEFTSRLIQNNYMSPHLQSIECSVKPALKCNLIKAITAYTREEAASLVVLVWTLSAIQKN